jgi:hypothetical protein
MSSTFRLCKNGPLMKCRFSKICLFSNFEIITRVCKEDRPDLQLFRSLNSSWTLNNHIPLRMIDICYNVISMLSNGCCETNSRDSDLFRVIPSLMIPRLKHSKLMIRVEQHNHSTRTNFFSTLNIFFFLLLSISHSNN